MIEEIFKLPVPATSLSKSPELRQGPDRISEIVCTYDDDQTSDVVCLSLQFVNRYGLRLTSSYACDVALIDSAYAKVVDLGESAWLKKIKSNLMANATMTIDLRHLAIYFDGDFLLEFVCESFQT